MRIRRYWALMSLWLTCTGLQGQLPVEIFTGHEKTTVDVMFFKFFKNKDGQASKWLFFNRNRAAVDYQQTTTSFLPQFGFTEALSYNHPALKGLAPVLVGQVLSGGVYAKSGFQYAYVEKNFTLFGWTVAGLQKKPNIDVFLLMRYTPKLGKKLNLFTQAEFLNTFPTLRSGHFSFTQRARVGLKIKAWQFGSGIDFGQLGRNAFVITKNAGAFLRYEFQ